MLVFAIAGAQLVDLGRATRSAPAGTPAGQRGAVEDAAHARTSRSPPGRRDVQLLLPSTLVPDNGNSTRYIATRLWSLDNAADRHGNRPQYPAHLVSQLGLHEPPVFGRWVIGLAAIGAVVALRQGAAAQRAAGRARR